MSGVDRTFPVCYCPPPVRTGDRLDHKAIVRSPLKPPGGDAERERVTGERPLVQIFVRDNNVDQALKALKKKMQREGSFREMKRHVHYEKPSEAR